MAKSAAKYIEDHLSIKPCISQSRTHQAVGTGLFKLPPYSVLLNHLYDCTFFFNEVTLLSFIWLIISNRLAACIFDVNGEF